MSDSNPKPKLFVKCVVTQEDADELMNNISDYVDEVIGDKWLEPNYQFYVSSNISYVFVSFE